MSISSLSTAQLWQHLALNEYAESYGASGFDYPTAAILDELGARVGPLGVDRVAQFYTGRKYDQVDIIRAAFLESDLVDAVARNNHPSGGHPRDDDPSPTPC